MRWKKFICARFKTVFIVFCFAFSLPALAWNIAGHRVIAAIAYAQLTPAARAQVDRLTQVFDPGYPAESRFLYASGWPDQIRMQNIHTYDAWHFIDLPFSPDQMPLSPARSDNLIWAIHNSITTLQNSTAAPKDQAIALAFLVHFVGDAHQPLHCSNRFTHEFPQGDAGGNFYQIKDPIAQNLHAYWDIGLGLLLSPLSNRQIKQLAAHLQQTYPRHFFTNAQLQENPTQWVQDSFNISKNFVYQVPENGTPSADYVWQGQKIVSQQLVLAGYRLADLLNNLQGVAQ